jgi:hypothetical protein
MWQCRRVCPSLYQNNDEMKLVIKYYHAHWQRHDGREAGRPVRAAKLAAAKSEGYMRRRQCLAWLSDEAREAGDVRRRTRRSSISSNAMATRTLSTSSNSRNSKAKAESAESKMSSLLLSLCVIKEKYRSIKRENAMAASMAARAYDNERGEQCAAVGVSLRPVRYGERGDAFAANHEDA